MRGGYRLGAGRPGREIKIEDCLRLSVCSLKNSGVLAQPWSGQWAWPASKTRNSQSIIEMSTSAGAVHLMFRWQAKPVTQRLVLARVPNTYGGHRTFFECPKCSANRREVYFLDGQFLCRACHRLAYQSQSEGRIDRLWRAERKLELKLGSRYKKPKGMHMTTFKRMQQQLFELEYQRESEIELILESAGMI